MEHWFSRDLQNFILHYAAKDPSKTIRASKIAFGELTNENSSSGTHKKYFIKNEWLHIAEKLQLLSNKIENGKNEINDIEFLIHIIKCNMLYLIYYQLLSYKKYSMYNPLTERTEYNIEDINEVVITAKGIDFIVNDGGLSSILGVVTVKLHNDTLQALLTDRIDQAEISDAEKSSLKNALSTIKEAGLAKITEMAIENAPWTSLCTAITKAVGLS